MLAQRKSQLRTYLGIESGEVDLEMAGVEVLPGDEEGADVAPDDTSVAEIDVELELTTTPEECA